MNESEQSYSLNFDLENLGQPQPWIVRYRGLEYQGEVIIAEAVNHAWGEPLEGDLSFRIVFYTVPRRIPPARIQDRRIAMVVPGRPPTQVRQSLRHEVRSVQETRERYVTGNDAASRAIRDSMSEREANLRGEIERRFGMAYSQGRIYTHPDIRMRASDFFVNSDLESWVDRIVESLLLLAHNNPPFDSTNFPQALTSDSIQSLYRGLFQRDIDAQELVGSFGYGLGIVSDTAPTDFDASQCRVVDIIQQQLDDNDDEISAHQLIQTLKYDYGLTTMLALFYLMAFVRQARAEIELEAGHNLEDIQGKGFLSDRITWDLIPEIAFSESLLDSLGMLHPEPSPVWNTALPYATLIVDGLEPSEDDASIAEQEQQLLEALEAAAPAIASTKEAMENLEQQFDADPQEVSEELDRLIRLHAASDYLDFYAIARDNFGGPVGLDRALDLYGRAQRVAEMAPSVAITRDYLGYMTFGDGHRDLELARDTEAARIDFDTLIENPSLWGSVEAMFQDLKEQYASIYKHHHDSYQQDALELMHRLEDLQTQVEALERLNEIDELGEPVGTQVQQMYKDVSQSYRLCSVSPDDLNLDELPYCQSCLLRLDDSIPRRDVEMLFGTTSRAMREYNRRLGSRGVRQVLAHPSKEQLDKFINLVQVADPSTLANVLDDEVVEFLRQFLRDQ